MVSTITSGGSFIPTAWGNTLVAPYRFANYKFTFEVKPISRLISVEVTVHAESESTAKEKVRDLIVQGVLDKSFPNQEENVLIELRKVEDG